MSILPLKPNVNKWNKIDKSIFPHTNSTAITLFNSKLDSTIGLPRITKFIRDIRTSVNKQIVEGNWFIKSNSMHLKHITTGVKINHHINIPSKQLNKLFSTLNTQTKINPYFFTGLVDAEGSFITTIYRNKNSKLGWAVTSEFQRGLHSRDIALLLQLQEFFGGIGYIYNKNTRQEVLYIVSKVSDLNDRIIPHFNKYPLLSTKRSDFELWKQIVEMMVRKEHLTVEGQQNLLISEQVLIGDWLKNLTNLFLILYQLIDQNF
jgi:LAGLIDADG endonuclease